MSHPPRIALLDVDPPLGEGLSGDELELARRHLVAVGLELPAGAWDPPPIAPASRAILGLLVTKGLLARETTLAGRTTAQLFGPSDLLRPWTDHGRGHPARGTVAWTVLTPVTVALLDRRFVTLAARWPSIVVEIARRSDGQETRTAIQLAIARLPRVTERLLLIFWHLAETLGRVTPDGIRIALPLTHGTIAAIVAASRPPVSAALAQLRRDGLVQRTREGWLVDPHVQMLTEAIVAA